MTGVQQDVSAACDDCPATYQPADINRPRPSAFVRKHVAETGHNVRVTHRKVTTYAPTHAHA
jgi:hypothetical protein